MSNLASMNKVHVVINAVYNNGEALCVERKAPAAVGIKDIPKFSGFREVAIRIVVPVDYAEELFEGLSTGSIELLVQDMKSRVERHK